MNSLLTICMSIFRMSRSERINLTEALEVVHTQFVAEEMEEGVLKGTTTPI
jgi:hypothetical protein